MKSNFIYTRKDIRKLKKQIKNLKLNKKEILEERQNISGLTYNDGLHDARQMISTFLKHSVKHD